MEVISTGLLTVAAISDVHSFTAYRATNKENVGYFQMLGRNSYE